MKIKSYKYCGFLIVFLLLLFQHVSAQTPDYTKMTAAQQEEFIKNVSKMTPAQVNEYHKQLTKMNSAQLLEHTKIDKSTSAVSFEYHEDYTFNSGPHQEHAVSTVIGFTEAASVSYTGSKMVLKTVSQPNYTFGMPIDNNLTGSISYLNTTVDPDDEKTITGRSNGNYVFSFSYDPTTNVGVFGGNAEYIGSWPGRESAYPPGEAEGLIQFGAHNDMSKWKGDYKGISANDNEGFFLMEIVGSTYKITYNTNYTKDGKTIIRSFTATIGFKQWEAFIVPSVAVDDYHKWLPEGPDPKDEKTTGNNISFTVFTKDKKKPDQKITANIKSVIYSLTNVSHEPGYSMNYPSDKPNTKADLQLLKTNEKPDPETEKLNLTLDSSEGRDVNVACFDYGAYGRIRATVILNDGTIVVAKEEKSQKPYATIPYRTDDNSEIADYWKEQNKATDLKDNDDNEKQNNLGDDHLGDGLTVYEEYRGFIENKKHIRTDPKKLDLMICDMIQDRAKDGIAMFKDVTGINIHDEFRLEEFGKPCNAQIEGLPNDKCINFNSSTKTHEVDQHGLAIIQQMEKVGYAQAVKKDEDGDLGTPKRYKYLEISTDFDPGPDGYSTIMGNLDPAGNISIDTKGKAKIITDEYARAVAHEMLHCCNVHHHGDANDIGKVTVCKVPSLSNTKIYTLEEDSTYKEAIYYWEDNDQQLTALDEPINQKGKFRLIIAGQGGTESGVEDCIMRYDNANAYQYIDGKIYVIRKKKGYYGELSGIGLCSSKKGTGVNASTHIPRPRYGDATAGNCRHQFCINDKYH